MIVCFPIFKCQKSVEILHLEINPYSSALVFLSFIYLLLTQMVNLCLVDFVVMRFQTILLAIMGIPNIFLTFFIFIFLLYLFLGSRCVEAL